MLVSCDDRVMETGVRIGRIVRMKRKKGRVKGERGKGYIADKGLSRGKYL